MSSPYLLPNVGRLSANLLKGILMISLLGGASSIYAADVKIAILNTQRAVIESEEAKKMIEKIRTELERDETAVKSLGEEIQKTQQRLTKDAATLSNTEKRRLQKEIEDKQIDYQFQVNKLQKEVQDRQQDIFVALAPKVDAVLKDLIAKEKYDIIMQRANLLYVTQALDITRQVTELLNKK